MKDFFISYNKADRDWAMWIAATLEAAGYTVIIQAWDFRPGENFILDMQRALEETGKTIAVLSEDYLKSSFTASEWSAVFAQDPDSRSRTLIPVKVRECKPKGLWGPLIHVDLVGLSETEAKAALLGAFEPRARPAFIPFPAQVGGAAVALAPEGQFPGPAPTANRATAVLDSPPPAADPAKISRSERIQLNKRLNSLPASQFNMLVSTLKPSPGVVAPMPAPQADRATQLFDWADGVSGSGLRVLQEVLQEITDPR